MNEILIIMGLILAVAALLMPLAVFAIHGTLKLVLKALKDQEERQQKMLWFANKHHEREERAIQERFQDSE